jgi:serine/threonine protein kinase
MMRIKSEIFDFGLAANPPRRTERKSSRLMTGGAGTPRYMAPEVAAMSETLWLSC